MSAGRPGSDIAPVPTLPPAPRPTPSVPVPAPAVPAPHPATENDEPGRDEPGPADDCDPDRSAGDATSAATKLGWGEPTRVEEFDGALDDTWGVYDGVGHGGNGRRTPDAVSIEDGVMTITGDSDGATAGLAWIPGQKYGRWEGRVRAPASDESYNALMLLWPDAENFPVGGEIDFMEMTDPTRQSTELFLHYGRENNQVQGEVEIDGTQWHNWAVEWTPTHVAAFVDGKEWWRTTDTSILPPGPMHLCIQLDWFPQGGDVEESYMYVDWVKQYSLDARDVAESVGKDLENVTAAAVEGATDAARSDVSRLAEGVPDVVRSEITRLTEGARDLVRSGPSRRPEVAAGATGSGVTRWNPGSRESARSQIAGFTDRARDVAPLRRGLVDRAVRGPGR